MNKADQRLYYLRQRADLPAHVAARGSRDICRRLLSSGLLDEAVIASYQPIRLYNEVDVRPVNSVIPDENLTIISPLSTAVIPEGQFDIILVPVVAFDPTGNRIGMGGGWYDRFLSLHQEAISIGLAFENCRAPHIPYEPHDIRLNYICTEKVLFRTKTD